MKVKEIYELQKNITYYKNYILTYIRSEFIFNKKFINYNFDINFNS